MVKPAETTAEKAETKPFPAWNEEEYYDKEIIPLLEELSEKCEARRIPILIHAICSTDSEKSTCGTIMNTCNRPSTEKMSVLGNILAGRCDAHALAIPLLVGALLGKAKKED